MRKVLLSAVALVALATVLVLPDTAEAKTTKVECGSTVTVDTVLKKDVTCSGWEYVSVAEGVTLDLAGHTITNASTFPSCGAGLIDPSPNGTGCAVSVEGTLRNGTVQGGVYASGLVERVVVKGVAAVASGILRASVVLDGNVRGIQTVTVEKSALVRAGITVDNINWGLGLYVRDSWIVDSPGDAIEIQTGVFPGEDDVGAEITGNLIVNAGADGIVAGGSADYRPSQVSRNVVWNSNGDGISWPGEAVSPVNPAWFSGPMSVDHNLVVGNAGHGITVDGSITRGNKSGNVALFNGTTPQCVNVRCWGSFLGA